VNPGGAEPPLTTEPVAETTHLDQTVLPSRTYTYRAVTILSVDGLTVESAPSPEVSITFRFP
jgi:hypothetical protein